MKLYLEVLEVLKGRIVYRFLVKKTNQAYRIDVAKFKLQLANAPNSAYALCTISFFWFGLVLIWKKNSLINDKQKRGNY